MLKIILGVIVGFIGWSVLWIGSDPVIMWIFPWYKEGSEAFMSAVEAKQPFEVSFGILINSLIRSVIISLISGFLAVFISKEQSKTTLILGVLLLLAGLSSEIFFWSYIPLWYHLSFLVLLIPMTILGGKLKKQTQGF